MLTSAQLRKRCFPKQTDTKKMRFPQVSAAAGEALSCLWYVTCIKFLCQTPDAFHDKKMSSIAAELQVFVDIDELEDIRKIVPEGG